MPEKKGKCSNFDYCETAKKRQTIAYDIYDPRCPECGKELTEVTVKQRKSSRLYAAIGALLALISVAGYLLIGKPQKPAPAPQPPPITTPAIKPEMIIGLFEQGDFEKALELLRKSAASPDIDKLGKEIETPVRLSVGFQYQKNGYPATSMSSVDSQPDNIVLTHKDNYRLEITLSSDIPNLYVYIFQKDQYGKIHRLFPEPILSQIRNPIQTNQTYRIPNKDWMYPDELSPTEKMPITESLYFIASPWDIKDMNELYGKIYKETVSEERSRLIRDFLDRLKLRAKSPVKSVFYKEFSFRHARSEANP